MVRKGAHSTTLCLASSIGRVCGLVGVLGVGIILGRVATADEVFVQKTREADGSLAVIDSFTKSIELLRDETAAQGQAVKLSCVDMRLKGARENRAVARGIRSRWDAGEDSPEYRERSLERLMRLQVYAMVFATEARNCNNAYTLEKALEVVAPPSSPAPEEGAAQFSPPLRLERPPLASAL